jgi:transposase-like protein
VPTPRPNRILTPELLDLVPDMVDQGLTKSAIAEQLGVTRGTLQVQCCRKNISLRPRRRVVLLVDQVAYSKLRTHAERRMKTAEALMATLINAAARDDIVDAVLDDGGSCVA